jgi:hypothetical protein
MDRSDIFKRSISFKRIMDGLQVRKIHNALFPKRNYSFRSDSDSTWYYDDIDSTAYCYGDSTAYGDGDNPWWYLDTAFCFGNSDVPALMTLTQITPMKMISRKIQGLAAVVVAA